MLELLKQSYLFQHRLQVIFHIKNFQNEKDCLLTRMQGSKKTIYWRLLSNNTTEVAKTQ